MSTIFGALLDDEEEEEERVLGSEAVDAEGEEGEGEGEEEGVLGYAVKIGALFESRGENIPLPEWIGPDAWEDVGRNVPFDLCFKYDRAAALDEAISATGLRVLEAVEEKKSGGGEDGEAGGEEEEAEEGEEGVYTTRVDLKPAVAPKPAGKAKKAEREKKGEDDLDAILEEMGLQGAADTGTEKKKRRRRRKKGAGDAAGGAGSGKGSGEGSGGDKAGEGQGGGKGEEKSKSKAKTLTDEEVAAKRAALLASKKKPSLAKKGRGRKGKKK